MLRAKRPTHQLTDGGPSVTPELPTDVAGPPFGAVPGSVCSRIHQRHPAKISRPQKKAEIKQAANIHVQADSGDWNRSIKSSSGKEGEAKPAPTQ
jgi:hypothetical protein